MKINEIILPKTLKSDVDILVTNMRKEARVTKRLHTNRTEMLHTCIVKNQDGSRLASIQYNNIIIFPSKYPSLDGSCTISYYDNEYIVDTLTGKVIHNPLSSAEKNNNFIAEIKNAIEILKNNKSIEKIKSSIIW